MTAVLEEQDGTTAPPAVSPAGGRAVTVQEPRESLTKSAGIGLGVAVIWLSLLVLIPLAAVVAQGFDNGWAGFWKAVTRPAAVDALVLTVVSSLLVAVINAVMGTLVAWVLVRDRFAGRRAIELVIDIPFALPTIVAGLVLLAVYGNNSPVHLDLYGTRAAIVVALLFVTLPFVVRTVQPVLLALDPEAELAAACLGAGPATVFRRIVLPLLLPAIASGATLAFARAVGEYGSVLLISGGLDKNRVTSIYVAQRIEAFDFPGAAAVATVLLAVSLVVILGLDVLQRWVARRG